MHSTFWTNTIWYIPLAILVFIQLIYTLSKTEKRRLTFAFFITVSGMTLNFETLILIFMKAYAYYPMIIKNSPNPFNDVLAGNLFSQFSISASTLLAVVLNLKYHWYLILAAIYGFIEEGFLALGVYKHNWYQTWMTVVMAPFSLWIAKKMYEKIIKGVKPVFYYAYIYFGLFTLYVITLLWGLHLSGYVEFSKTVFKDPINSVYFLILAIFFIPPSILEESLRKMLIW